MRGLRRPRGSCPSTVQAARRLNRGTALLASSVLLDSSLEHYRGSFRNPLMFLPPAVAALTLGISAHGTADTRPLAHRARQVAFAAAALTGLAGTGLHVYNVLKRPGRLAWQNLFYGAPIGAPMAILLAGLLGVAAEEVRHTRPGRSPRVMGLPGGRLLALVSGAGLCGTAAEAALLHFRGAYHNPAMFAPVTIAPLSAALLLKSVCRTPHRPSRIARVWLRITVFLGFAGVGLHAYGVSRNMGGWRNWSQNLLSGPPLPAPPSFTGLALAGLAALGLLEDHPHA